MPTPRTLEGACANLLAWAVAAGHDARASVVPRWARPIMADRPPASIVDVPPAQSQYTLLDMPVFEKQSKSKAKKHHRFERPQGA